MKIRILPLLVMSSLAALMTGCVNTMPIQPEDNRLTKMAAELGRHGDTASSIALYERAALAMPDNLDVLLALGQAHLKNEDARAATAVFQQAYRLQEGNPHALLGLGQAALMEGRIPRAKELIAEAASALQTSEAYNLLGISLTLNQDMNAAIEAFQRAQQLTPASLELQTNEALAHALSGEFAAAIQKVSAVTASPLAEAHHVRRAVLILMLAGDDAQAVMLSRELPEDERASLIGRAKSIRDLPSRAEQVRAMGMIAVPSRRPGT